MLSIVLKRYLPTEPSFFFFNDTATPEIYPLSLHDALPISITSCCLRDSDAFCPTMLARRDRKSTRLNSSHLGISYAVFCLKKKNKHGGQKHAPAAPREALLQLRHQ